MLHPDSFCVYAITCFLLFTLPVSGLGTKFPNSTLFTSTPTSTSPVSSIRVTPGASSLSGSVDPEITLAGSCGFIDASLGTPRTVVWQNTGSHYDITGYVKESDWNTLITYAFAQSRVPPPQCCASCSIQASVVQVQFWAPETVSAAATTPAPKVPYTLVSDGYTYTSPSVYVVYSGLYAQADCPLYGDGPIGNNISATTVAYPPDALSTAECYGPGDGGFNGWKTINYTNWANPVPNSVLMTQSGCKPFGGISMTDDPAGTNLVASPQFSLPQGLSTLEPAWSEYKCVPWRYGAFDPPRTLTKADAMISTQAASATPAAQVSPPGSHITSVTMPADPKVAESAFQSGIVPVVPVSEDPGHKSTPTSKGSDPSKADPAATHPKPELPSASTPTTAHGPDDPHHVPSPTNQDPNPDPAHATGAKAQTAVDPVPTGGSATYQNHVDLSSNLAIASKTAQAGGPAISVTGVQIGPPSSANSIVLDGPLISLAAPAPAVAALPKITMGNAVITANTASQYIIYSQTLSPGAAVITISGTPISLGSSASHVVFGGSTILLISQSLPTLPAFTVGDQVVTANSATQYVVNDQTLMPGAAAITVIGTPLSLDPLAAKVVIGSSTIPLVTSVPSSTPVIAVGNQFISAAGSSNYVINSQTLVPGAPAITVSGTPISLAASAFLVVVGSSTIRLLDSSPSIPTPIVVNGQTITANSASQFVVAGQTLTPGAPAVTIAGTPVSIPANPQPVMTIGSKVYPVTVNSAGDMIVASQTIVPGGSPVIIGGETISGIPNGSELIVASGASTTTEGLGQLIAGALGKTALATRSVGANASSTGLTFTGGASQQSRVPGLLLWMLVTISAACVIYLQ